LLVIQANTGLLTGYRRDSTVRSIGIGWRKLANEIEAVRLRVGATCVLGPNYGTTAWLAFYLPKNTCVAQRTQRYRWFNLPEPDQAMLTGKLLFVDETRPNGKRNLPDSFTCVKVAEFQRKRGPLLIETIEVDVAEATRGEALDRSPPPELTQRVYTPSADDVPGWRQVCRDDTKS
jgi:hypothetical protein